MNRLFILAALGLLLLSLLFVLFGQVVVVAGGSMYPTLHNGDLVVVEALSTQLPFYAQLRRGEVVVFKNPHRGPDDDSLLIKRVVGLPGETVHMASSSLVVTRACDAAGAPLAPARSDVDSACKRVFEAGSVLGRKDNTETFSMYLGPEDYLLLGDDRIDSSDSRYYGAVQKSDLVGRAAFRLWPLARMGPLFGAVE